ncbi:hypothetical protein [Bacillus sp. M6-12]|uniref:hypothetical protein n=1 Tax=Bacillus sp. M6-12 TaxID=2054166 RepID=UPI0015E0AAEC|nr:hypothetical protein [Bacillus sp. M6-12]
MKDETQPRKLIYDENGLHETTRQISESYISGCMTGEDCDMVDTSPSNDTYSG